MIPFDVPLIPDGEEGRTWVEQELRDPAYARAQPNPIDRAARAVSDLLGDLFSGSGSVGWGPVLAVVAAVVILAIIVVVLVLAGRPRRRARSAVRRGTLFGEDETRTAAQLRADADAAAAAGNWSEAIATRVRAIARALDERGLVETPPGATVHAFARQAGGVFPAEGPALHRAADDFDDVRYLRRPGTPEAYDRACALDDRLAQPRLPVGAAR